MKNLAHSLRPLSVLLCLLFALLANQIRASLLYWDNNGTGTPTSGIWDLTTANWATSTNLKASTVAWDGLSAAAFPAGTGNLGTVTITVNTSGINFAGLYNSGVTNGGVTNLIFSGTGSLNLVNAGVQEGFLAGANFNSIVKVPITGSGGIQWQGGGGSLYLSGANTYSAGTSLASANGLNFNIGSAFGSGPITNAVATTVLATPATDSSGAAFATSPMTVANNMQLYGGAGDLIFVGASGVNITWTGNWSLLAAAGTTETLDWRNATMTISGVMSGAANFTKTGSGTLVLSGPNTYSGKTIVANSTVSLSSLNKVSGGAASSSLGAPTTVANGTIGLGSGGNACTLIYTGSGETSDRVIDLSGTTGAAAIEMDGTGPLILSSAFTATGAGSKTLTLQGSSTAANVINGAIVDNSSANKTTLTKAGNGTWVLGGANTYSGNTTVSAGTVRQGAANVIPNGSGKGTFAVSSGATFDLGGFNCTVNNAATAGTIDNATGGGTPTLTIGGNNTGVNISGPIKNTSGTLSLAKIGTGAMALSSVNNTFSGKTSITAGTLNISSNVNLGATFGSYTPDAVTISSGGTLGLTASAADIDANRGITVGTGGGTISASANQSPSIESIITGSGVLTKSSAGNLNLNAANTFTAGLTITGGGVRFNNNQAAGTGPIIVTPASIITLRQLNPPGPTSVTLTNPMILNANAGNDIDLTAATGNSFNLSGPISGVGYFTRGRASGTGGTVTLSGSNSFSGGVFLQGGTLAVGSSNALGTGVLTIDPGPNNAAMLQAATPLTDANAITNVVAYIVTNTSMQVTVSGTNDLELAGPMSITNTVGSTVALTNNNNGATILSGVISGPGVGLLTTGSGTVTVRGNNTYSGGTTVAGGKLLVNNSAGSGTGSGAVTVNTGATLGGTGTIAGLVTVSSGATLSPGVSIGTLTLTVAPSLAGTTAMDLNNAAGPILTSDKLVVSPGGGTLTYGGALVLTSSGLPISAGDTFALFAADSFGGAFGSVTPPPGPGLAWDTSRLTVDGTIKAVCDGTLAASAGANQTTCSGAGVTIGGSPTATGGSGSGYTCSWSPTTALNDPTLANPTASPTSTTVYTVTVTDPAGCTAHASVTVSVDVPPSITAQPSNQTGCSGSSVTLSVSGAGSGLSYSWAKHSNAGWGSAWSVSGGGSTFRASATDNDFGDPACTSFTSAFDINSPSGNALGMWGGFSGDEAATRSFAALTSGQTVSIDFDNGNVDTGSKVGFSLQTSGGADVLQFYFLGGQSNYKYNDGAEQDSGLPFQRTGLRVQFVLLSGTAYKLIVTPCGGTATTFTGTYSGTIAQLKLFNQNTTGGNDKNIYFNNFLVGGYVDSADNYSGDYAGQDKGDQPIASGNGGSSYTTPLLTVGDNGAQYEVVVDGCAGSVLSTAATVTVNPAPTASAGGNQTICVGTSTAGLGGVVGGGATGGTWSSSGTGTFVPNATTLNASYTPSAADITAGTVTLTLTTTGQLAPCTPATAQVVLTINPAPTASAGGNQTTCAGTSTAGLGGVIGGGATGGTWSSSGTGTFAPDANILNATYTPSAADVTAGSVTLTLTTTGQLAPCPAATAQVIITINPAATASTGGNQSICAGTSTAGLGGAIGGATGGTWSSSGSGSFVPNATALNATYTPSPVDVTAGTVTLTLTTTGQLAPCSPATAQVVVTINPAATASAGGNQTICAGSSTVGLGGSVGGGATGGTWSSSGTGSFVPNATTLNATYTPSAADITAGTVTLTLTTTGQLAPCGPATAQVVVTINPAATASAGGNQTICAGTSTAGLGGSVGGGATGGTWSSSGSGSFVPNATALNATYTPSAADIAAGAVTLTLTSTGQLAPCSAATAQVIVTINPAATASAGGNQTICASTSTAGLGGSVGGGATGGTWSSSGTGSFVPNATALNATYTPSAADISAGSVTLTLTTSGQLAPCSPATAQVVLTINALPAITAGPANLAVCAGSPAIFQVSATGAGLTYQWQVSADGGATFTNISDTATNASYTNLATALADNGNEYQVIVSGACSPSVTSAPPAVLTVNSPATASAGGNQSICAGASTAGLGGSVGGGATGGTWSSSGTGSFVPNATALNATYTPSPADIAAGTVTLTLTSTGQVAPCGAATAQVIVTINAAPVANAGPDQTVCPNRPVMLGGSPTGSGGTGPYTYSWAPSAGLSDPTVANPVAMIAGTTTYTVTVTDANGCADSDSVVLTIPPQPEIQSITMSGTDVTLVWTSVPGLTYRVQYKTDLNAAEWTDLAPDITATGATTTKIDSVGAAAQRFYRISFVCP
jgi:autotransporter-associated beta strand protein